jgi:hypothetical protein
LCRSPQSPPFLLATNPAALTQVLGVVYRTISGFLLRRAGLTRATGATGFKAGPPANDFRGTLHGLPRRGRPCNAENDH